MELTLVAVTKPDQVNVILGHAHFIKTVEDLHEALVQAVPGIAFGVAFCEASGARLVRYSGTDEQMSEGARQACRQVGAGHFFAIFLANAFPINVLNAIKNVPEVCRIFCATANPVEVVVVETGQGRGVLGVVDGASPLGEESEEQQVERHALLRRIGYKL